MLACMYGMGNTNSVIYNELKQTGNSLWKTMRQFFKKLEIQLPHGPSVDLSDIHQRTLHPTVAISIHPCLLLLYF